METAAACYFISVLGTGQVICEVRKLQVYNKEHLLESVVNVPEIQMQFRVSNAIKQWVSLEFKNTLIYRGLVVGSEKRFDVNVLGSAFYPEILRSQWVAVISFTLLLFRVIAAQATKECTQNTLSALAIPSCCHSPLQPPAADVIGNGLPSPQQQQRDCNTGSRQLCYTLLQRHPNCSIWIRRPCILLQSTGRTMPGTSFQHPLSWQFLALLFFSQLQELIHPAAYN